MSASAGAPLVTLYGRPGCHLCEEARDGLLELQREGARFELREVNIESEESLHRSMLELIPVVEVEGERISELMLDRGALLRGLDTLSR